MIFIYKITFPNNGFYIGLTTRTLKRRQIQHKCFAKYSNKYPINRAFNKYGFENTKWEILSEHNTLNEAEIAEKRAIKELKPRYNVASGGNCVEMTPEIIKKILDTKTKRNSFKHTQKAKKKMHKSQIIYWSNKDVRETASKRMKEMWKNPVFRKNRLIVLRKSDVLRGITRSKINKNRRYNKLKKIANLWKDGISISELSRKSGMCSLFITRWKEEWLKLIKPPISEDAYNRYMTKWYGFKGFKFK